MLKTIAKPVYNWVIGTDNDEVMKKFTKQMLPETQFRGHHEEYQIASHANDGEGCRLDDFEPKLAEMGSRTTF